MNHIFLAKVCFKMVVRSMKNPEAIVFLLIPTIKYYYKATMSDVPYLRFRVIYMLRP